MQQLTNVIYDNKPDTVTVTPTIVDVVKRCDPVMVKDQQDDKEYPKFECDIDRYSVDEYIGVLHTENVAMEAQLIDTQEALDALMEGLI